MTPRPEPDDRPAHHPAERSTDDLDHDAIDPDVPEPERLTVRTPEDALAAIPVMLGFVPQESLVVMALGGERTFHARVDLPGRPGRPPRPAAVEDCVGQLLEPSTRLGARQAVLVAFSQRARTAERVRRRAEEAFHAAGIEVVLSLRADGRRWWSSGRPESSPGGHPYDAAAHDFRARAVLRGQVVHASREDLAAVLAPVPDRVRAVMAARRGARSVDAAGVAALVERGVAAGRLDDHDLAVLLLSLRRPTGRDAAWCRVTRPVAEEHVRFWTDAVQRAPADLVSHAGSVLGMVAWMSGHGALAWCAVDRAQVVAPRHSLAELVEMLLAGAVPPDTWDEVRLDLLRHLDDDPDAEPAGRGDDRAHDRAHDQADDRADDRAGDRADDGIDHPDHPDQEDQQMRETTHLRLVEDLDPDLDEDLYDDDGDDGDDDEDDDEDLDDLTYLDEHLAALREIWEDGPDIDVGAGSGVDRGARPRGPGEELWAGRCGDPSCPCGG